MGAHYALSLCWQFRFPIYSRKQVNLSNRWIPRLKPGNSGPGYSADVSEIGS